MLELFAYGPLYKEMSLCLMFKVPINLDEWSFKDREEPWRDHRVLNISSRILKDLFFNSKSFCEFAIPCLEYSIYMFLHLHEVNHGVQVALLCHKVRDATRPPVSGSIPVICTQLSSWKYVLPATLDFIFQFQFYHLLSTGQEVLPTVAISGESLSESSTMWGSYGVSMWWINKTQSS